MSILGVYTLIHPLSLLLVLGTFVFFQYKNALMKSDQNLVSSTFSCTVTGTLCMVLKGKTGGSSWPRRKLVASLHISHATKHVKGP